MIISKQYNQKRAYMCTFGGEKVYIYGSCAPFEKTAIYKEILSEND